MCHRIATLLLSLTALSFAPLPRQDPFAARPSPEHALLEKLAGKWSASFTLRMPGGPPVKSHATEVNEMLGKLWLVSRYDDPGMAGHPFAGAQILGYDPDAKAYVGAWADTESANLSVQKGSYDATSRTLTLVGTSKDPFTGADSSVRTVMTLSDDDHRTQSMYVPGPGGKEMELFKIEYERVK